MGSSAGVVKVAAARVGVSLEEYVERLGQGLKWCFRGKHWQPVAMFQKDLSRGDGLKATCRECPTRPRKQKALSCPSQVIQAAASNAVRTAVRNGVLPKVTLLDCKCGKKARHYHHYLGYSKEHWLDVRACCVSCHKKEHWES